MNEQQRVTVRALVQWAHLLSGELPPGYVVGALKAFSPEQLVGLLQAVLAELLAR